MAFLKWSLKYLTGSIDAINDNHKGLFYTINEFVTVSKKAPTPTT